MFCRVKASLLLSTLLLGCSHTLDQGYRDTMLAHEIQCSREEVAVTERGPNVFEVKGCGRHGTVRCSSRACANLTAMAQERFEREHGCSRADSAAKEISPLVFKVDGCAKSSNYVCDMRDHLARCVIESAYSSDE